jgi:hypothetical protein
MNEAGYEWHLVWVIGRNSNPLVGTIKPMRYIEPPWVVQYRGFS